MTGIGRIRSCARSTSPSDDRGRDARPAGRGGQDAGGVGGPLIYALEERDRKALFFGFDLFRTDFPLAGGLPPNPLQGAALAEPGRPRPVEPPAAGGQPILLPVEHGVTTATVRTPSGVACGQVNRAWSFTDTDEVGIYAVVTGRGETKVAVNLMNADESDLTRSRADLRGGGAARVPAVLNPARAVAVLRDLPCCCSPSRASSTGGARPGPSRAAPRLGDRWALACAARCSRAAPVADQADDPAWADRLTSRSCSTCRQREPGRARERVPASRPSRSPRSAGRPGGRVVFGEEAMVDQPLRPTSKIERPQPTSRARHQSRAGPAARPGHRAARQANRSCSSPTDARTWATARVAQAAKTRAPTSTTCRPLPSAGVCGVDVAAPEVKVRRALPGQGVAWSQAEAQGRLSLYRNGSSSARSGAPRPART